MNKPGSASAHYFLRALILLGFLIYMIYLFKTNSLVYYIAPRMVIYMKLATLGLYLVAIFQIIIAIRSLKRRSITCECEPLPNRSLVKNIAIYSLFILPLLLGFLMPNQAMPSSLVAKKGINLNGISMTTNVANGSGDSGVTFKADKYTQDFAKLGVKLYQENSIELTEDMFLEKLQSLNIFIDNFIGKEMKVTGFVYRDPGMHENQLIVGRFAITCCTADALPYGVIIESSDANRFADDTWVTVTGTIDKTKYKDQDVLKINATQIEKTKAPNNPYVYPNYDFASQL
jgi:uncharacterized repeat protein (TIGR03943 family)